MAHFKSELPTELMDQLKSMEDNTDAMMAGMTRAGAEVVASNAKVNAPDTIKPYVKISKSYKTPSNGGINTQVYVSGYIPFSDPKRKYFARRNGHSAKIYKTTLGVPAEFLANIYEYGRNGYPFPKHPFLRKSFKKNQIEKAMNEAQEKFIKDPEQCARNWGKLFR